MDSLSMRDYIRNFSLDDGPHGNQGYSRVLLQLFGFTGHGKSSFINSCKYVVDDGAYTMYAKVASSEEKPETMIRNAFELTSAISMVDNRGCAKMNKNETGEIYAQLGNFLPLDCEVKWHSDFKDMMNILLIADMEEQSADFIVPVLVYSAKNKMTPAEEGDLKEILMKAWDITGLIPTVVITNKLSEHLPDTQEKFRRMRVENIYPVENYTKEDHRKTRGKHETLLQCLSAITKDVEFRMTETRDPKQEKLARKRILYEFAHKRDMEKVQEEESRRRREELSRAQERENQERARREELARELERRPAESCALQ
ncbi:uncharacterized protein LOC122944775 isoform X1 [Bufo gargarizans]|uniref:uncharacterized protein LOC122944775 isoform X1 n=1 Tax=Bufo gargarizans TaxID=30331 RepID=UPI001CF1958D|nr:uncharacterized protein LOC122944775 isoform X1 [Bufo gargarizans]